MNRRFVLVAALALMAGAMVLNTSLKTRVQEDRLAQINREIASEQERIRVLTAEWHSLKSPGRIEALTRRYIKDMNTIKPVQIASLADIPDRLPEPETPAPTLAQAGPKTETVSKPVQLASAAKPATRSTALAATPATATSARATARPAQTIVASAKPAAPKPIATTTATIDDSASDQVASLINQQSAPAAPKDEISFIIERDSQPRQPDVVTASFADDR